MRIRRAWRRITRRQPVTQTPVAAKRRSTSAEYYQTLFDTLVITPGREAQVQREVNRILKMRPVYEKVSAVTGVPWWFIGLTHELECDCNPNGQILNGQDYRKRTTIVPVGRGPWASWEESAIDGLKDCPIKEWSIPVILHQLERWNGMGYQLKGKNSPYLWNFSQHGEGVGLYYADGQYSPTRKSAQVGAAVLLKELLRLENNGATA